MSSNEWILVNEKYDDNYGFPFEQLFPGWSSLNQYQRQFFRELYAYKILRGAHGKTERWKLEHALGCSFKDFQLRTPFFHLCNAIQLAYIKDPSVAQFTSRGYTNDFMLMGLKALCENNSVSFAGSASTGKTYVAGLWGVFDWLSAPNCTLTLVASNKLASMEDRIWRDISRLWRAVPGDLRTGHIIDYKHSIVFEKPSDNEKGKERESSNAIKAFAIEKGSEGEKSIEDTRGRKNKRVRVILDEMAEMDMRVIDIRVNLRSNPDFVMCGIANPANNRNPHFDFSLPKGYEDFPEEHRNWDEWETRTGKCFFFSGERSPNLQAPEDEPPPFETLMTRDALADMLVMCHGDKNALAWWRNAVGGWPPSGVSLSVLTKPMLISSKTKEEPAWRSSDPFVKIATLDPAFTHSGDRAPLCIGKMGTTILGKRTAYIQEIRSIVPKATDDYIESLAESVVKILISEEVEPENFGMDVSNDGGTVARSIIRIWQKTNPRAINIQLISSNGRPTDRPASDVDSRPCSELYDRLVSEYWFSVATAIQTRCLFGLDPDSSCAGEFYARSFNFKGKRQSIITKREMKELIGRSPDEADAVSYFVEMCRRRGLYFKSDSEIVSWDKIWEDVESRKNKQPQEVVYGDYRSVDWGEVSAS